MKLVQAAPPPLVIFLLTVPRRCFFCGSYLLFVFVPYCHQHVCFLQPCAHLLGRADLLALLYVMLTCVCSGSGVVLDCIDS